MPLIRILYIYLSVVFVAAFGYCQTELKSPVWYDQNRVQAHTRLGPVHPSEGVARGWLDTPESTQASIGFKELGASVITRHFKSRDEDPWWPSQFPLSSAGEELFNQDRWNQGVFLEKGRNLAREMIDDAHSQSIKIIAYYWHMTDATVASLYPEWVCYDPEGNPVQHTRGTLLDITGGYRDIVLGRLLELAEMGVDGFFFDEQHLPKAGCWDSPLQTSFETQTGLSAPSTLNQARQDSHWQQFKAQAITDTFRYWVDGVRAKYPDLAFIVSEAPLSALTTPQTNSELLNWVIPKTELSVADRPNNQSLEFDKHGFIEPNLASRRALAWTFLRDVSVSPPLVWAPGFPDTEQTLAFVGAVLTYGGVASIDVIEENVLEARNPPGATSREAIQAAFALGQKVSPYLSGSSPVKWAAIHLSEQSRNKRTPKAAWQDILWPINGAFEALTQAHLPVSIITDEQLEQGQLHDFKLLFLPRTDELSLGQRQQLDKFRQSGGIVIENRPQWQWGLIGHHDQTKNDFLTSLLPYKSSLLIESKDAAPTIHMIPYLKEQPRTCQLMVAITKDFSGLQVISRKNPIPEELSTPQHIDPGGTLEIYLHNLPECFQKDHQSLNVVEAIHKTPLMLHTSENTLTITLPDIQSMLLLSIEP